MPFIRVTLSKKIESSERNALATGITGLMARILGKKPELTSVLVESTGEYLWKVGAEPPPCAAHLEANITAGTNTEQEKSDFIREATALLRRHGGALPEATYVIVREVPATDWGYDGRTQLSRRPK